MKACIGVLLVIGCSLSTPTFAVLDTFDTNSLAGSNWGPVTRVGGGDLAVVNGALQYTSTTAANGNFAAVTLNTSENALAHDWSFTVDITMPGISFNNAQQRLLMGIEVIESHQNPNDNLVTLVYDSRTGNGAHQVTESEQVGNTQTSSKTEDCSDSTHCGGASTLSDTIAVRMTYEASSKTLTTWFDPDGSANNVGGENFNVLATRLPFTPHALFLFGQSDGLILVPGQAAADNVNTTLPVPEPSTYALVALGLALLLFAPRRGHVALRRTPSRAAGLR